MMAMINMCTYNTHNYGQVAEHSCMYIYIVPLIREWHVK